MHNRRRMLIASQDGGKLKYHWDYTQGLTNDIFTIETTGSSTYELTTDGLKMNTYGNWEKVFLNLNDDILALMFQRLFKVKFTFYNSLRGWGRGESYYLFFNALRGAFYVITDGTISKWEANNSKTLIKYYYTGNTLTIGGDYTNSTSFCEEGNWNGNFAWLQQTPARLFYFHGSANCEMTLQSVDIEFN